MGAVKRLFFKIQKGQSIPHLKDIQYEDPRLKDLLKDCPDSPEVIKPFYSSLNSLRYGDTPLHNHSVQWAVDYNKPKIAAYILKCQYCAIDTDTYFKGGVAKKSFFSNEESGYSLIFTVISKFYDDDLLKILLRKTNRENRYLKFGDKNGTALHYTLRGRINLQKRYVEQNKGNTEQSEKIMYALVERLLKEEVRDDAGAGYSQVKTRDIDGNTPLHSAMLALQDVDIDKAAIKVFKLLLDYKADPEAKNNHGVSLKSFLEARERYAKNHGYQEEIAAIEKIRDYMAPKKSFFTRSKLALG